MENNLKQEENSKESTIGNEGKSTPQTSVGFSRDAKSTYYVLDDGCVMILPIFGLSSVSMNPDKTKILVTYSEFQITIEGTMLGLLVQYYHNLTISRLTKGKFLTKDEFNKSLEVEIKSIRAAKRDS